MKITIRRSKKARLGRRRWIVRNGTGTYTARNFPAAIRISHALTTDGLIPIRDLVDVSAPRGFLRAQEWRP